MNPRKPDLARSPSGVPSPGVCEFFDCAAILPSRHPAGSLGYPKDLGGGESLHYRNFPPPGPSPRRARLRMTVGGIGAGRVDWRREEDKEGGSTDKRDLDEVRSPTPGSGPR